MRVFFTRVTAFSFSLILLALSSQAQFSNIYLEDPAHTWELNFTAGANNFLGDLGGNLGVGKPFLKDYMFKTVKPLFGVSASYNYTKYLAFDGGFNYTSVTGGDSLIHNTGNMERWRYYRNLSFTSKIVEGFLTATVYPLMYKHREDFEIHRFNPYISAGIGLFHFNPKAEYNGSWIDLKPLSLEGQNFTEYADRKPYSLTQLYIPVNIGAKYFLDNVWSISAGMQMRTTFTDYIDDISTTYIDPALFDKYLAPDKATVAKQMYARSIRPEKVKPGIAKADNKDNDSYLTFYLSVSIRFPKYVRFYFPKL